MLNNIHKAQASSNISLNSLFQIDINIYFNGLHLVQCTITMLYFIEERKRRVDLPTIKLILV